NDQFAVFYSEPGPSGAELGHAGLGEIFLHLGDTAKIAVDLCLQFAGVLVAATIRLLPLPEMGVVVLLTRVVEEPGVLAEVYLLHLFERFALQPAAFQKFVAIINISLVVLVVVIFERLA